MAKARKDELAVEQEIQAERANALGVSGDRLEVALAEYARAEAALAAASPSERQARVEERQLRLAEAAERLWFVIVQREVVGIGNHEPVWRVYDVPAEVRRHMGPRLKRGQGGEAVRPGPAASASTSNAV